MQRCNRSRRRSNIATVLLSKVRLARRVLAATQPPLSTEPVRIVLLKQVLHRIEGDVGELPNDAHKIYIRHLKARHNKTAMATPSSHHTHIHAYRVCRCLVSSSHRKQ